MCVCVDVCMYVCVCMSIDGVSTLASGSAIGHIAVWNLDERRLQAVLHDAHSGPVPGLRFLPQQPLMITSSPDNSLKVFAFLHTHSIL